MRIDKCPRLPIELLEIGHCPNLMFEEICWRLLQEVTMERKRDNTLERLANRTGKIWKPFRRQRR